MIFRGLQWTGQLVRSHERHIRHPTALVVAFIATANWITSGNSAWTLPCKLAGRPCRKDRRKAAGEFSASAPTTTRCVRSSVQHGDCEPVLAKFVLAMVMLVAVPRLLSPPARSRSRRSAATNLDQNISGGNTHENGVPGVAERPGTSGLVWKSMTRTLPAHAPRPETTEIHAARFSPPTTGLCKCGSPRGRGRHQPR